MRVRTWTCFHLKIASKEREWVCLSVKLSMTERERETDKHIERDREKNEGCVNGVKVLYKSARRLRGLWKVALVEDVFFLFCKFKLSCFT